MAQQIEMSKEAIERISNRIAERNARLKAQDEKFAAQKEEDKKKFINLGDGEKIVVRFDVEKETRYKEFANNFGGISKKYFYPVIEANTGEDRVFSANVPTSKTIDVFLNKGVLTLEIERQGTGKQTQYIVTQELS